MDNKWKITEILGEGERIKKLNLFIHNKEKYYHEFFIEKANGKKRRILAPVNALGKVQKKILKRILYPNLSISDHAKGFVPGKSIIDNAKVHLGNKVILKIDLEDFFESIKQKRVAEMFMTYTNFNLEASEKLAELVCYDNRLPTGAPTSPFISNKIAYWIDQRVSALCKNNNLKYSRYADDITISGRRIKKSLKNKIFKIIEDEGFRINKSKTKFVSRYKRQRITGVTINENLSAGREYYRKMRAILRNCHFNGVEKTLVECQEKKFYKMNDNPRHFMHFLKGHISFIKSINRNQGDKLFEEFKKINWIGYLPISKVYEQYEMIDKMLFQLNKLGGVLNDGKNLRTEIIKVASLYKRCKREEDFIRLCLSLSEILKVEIKKDFFTQRIIDPSKIVDEDGKITAGNGIIINYWLTELKERPISSFIDISDLSNGPRHLGEKPNTKYFEAIKKYTQKEGLSIQYEGLWIAVVKKLDHELARLTEIAIRNK